MQAYFVRKLFNLQHFSHCVAEYPCLRPGLFLTGQENEQYERTRHYLLNGRRTSQIKKADNRILICVLLALRLALYSFIFTLTFHLQPLNLSFLQFFQAGMVEVLRVSWRLTLVSWDCHRLLFG